MLRGKISEAGEGMVIIDCGGVGYLVRVPRRWVVKIKQENPVRLFIYTHVREDALALYGFEEMAGREWFEELISVSGIGPKVAMSLFDVMGGDEMVSAVQEAEVERFTNIPGIGKKTAQRLVIELRGKVGSKKELDLKQGQVSEEAVTALMGLGLKKNEAAKALAKVDQNKSVEEQIKEALKYV